MTNQETSEENITFDLSRATKYSIMIAIGAAATAGLAIAARRLAKSEQGESDEDI